MKHFILLLAVGFIGYACGKKKDCGDPAVTSVALLLKSATGELLVGENKMYHPDTINSLNLGQFSAEDSLIFLQIHTFDEGDPLFLNLSRNDQDTVITSTDLKDFECFSVPKLIGMTYNGISVFTGETYGRIETIEIVK